MTKNRQATFWVLVLLTLLVLVAGIYEFAGYAAAGVCSGKDGRAFSFIVFGDSRGTPNGVNPILNQLVKHMTAHIDTDTPSPSFAVFLGDAADAGGRDNIEEWDNITSPMSAKIPLLFVKGNHDINVPGKTYYLDSEFQQFQRKRLDTGAAINKKCVKGLLSDSDLSAFSFVWNGALFVILDTYEVPMPDGQGNGQSNGWISQRQLKMLAAELDNHTMLHKFVFTHAPAFDNAEHGNIASPMYYGSWSPSFMQMWKTIDKNAVDIVFSGHDHYYARKKIDQTVAPQWKNGVLQVISGGAGAPFYDPERCTGGICLKYDNPPEISKIYHFIIVTVAPHGVSYKLYDKDDKQIEQYDILK